MYSSLFFRFFFVITFVNYVMLFKCLLMPQYTERAIVDGCSLCPSLSLSHPIRVVSARVTCLSLWLDRTKGVSSWLVRRAHLEVWHQPAGLQVQRVLVEAQLPVHHLLVVELKLNVAARRNVDLGLEGLHVLSVGPARREREREGQS